MKIKKRLVPSIVEGFTLIEILVVIAIIGSLSALLLPNYMEARMRARDTQRKNDLKAIQKALEIYKLDNDQKYPLTAAFPDPGERFAHPTNNASVYMKSIPKDPVTLDGYEYTSASDLDYTLCACLENTADKEGVDADCPGDVLKCKTVLHGLSYQLTPP